MLSNPESTTHHAQPRFHGSSLSSQENPLDQERAASMADEGGVSGALTDAREQAAEGIAAHPLARARSTRSRWLPWALAAAGALFLVRLSVLRLLRS